MVLLGNPRAGLLLHSISLRPSSVNYAASAVPALWLFASTREVKSVNSCEPVTNAKINSGKRCDR
jgi:hypothetical protein